MAVDFILSLDTIVYGTIYITVALVMLKIVLMVGDWLIDKRNRRKARSEYADYLRSVGDAMEKEHNREKS